MFPCSFPERGRVVTTMQIMTPGTCPPGSRLCVLGCLGVTIHFLGESGHSLAPRQGLSVSSQEMSTSSHMDKELTVSWATHPLTHSIPPSLSNVR